MQTQATTVPPLAKNSAPNHPSHDWSASPTKDIPPPGSPPYPTHRQKCRPPSSRQSLHSCYNASGSAREDVSPVRPYPGMDSTYPLWPPPVSDLPPHSHQN